ncbi:MAG: hypothetical protein K6G50_11135 [bacterium]|nr:hypothetical protein [bacterium]
MGNTDTYSIHSHADRDFGIFLIFTGLVGSVPLYYLYIAIFTKSQTFDWRVGASFGLAVAFAGLMMIILSQKRFTVSAGENGGHIKVRDGFFGRTVQYKYGSEPQIYLQVAQSQSGNDSELWQVSLAVGKCRYLIDSRSGRLQASRGIAEFLAKSIVCPLVVHPDIEGPLELDPHDLDLPFAERAAKYPRLLGQPPVRPENCPIKIEDRNGGTDRCYSWGLGASGMISEILGCFIIAAIIGVLPVFGNPGSHYSLLSQARADGNYFYFIGIAAFFVFVILAVSGWKAEIELTQGRVNARKSVWGISYNSSSILREHLEEISSVSKTSGAAVRLISDDLICDMRLGDAALAEYAARDIRHSLAGLIQPSK